MSPDFRPILFGLKVRTRGSQPSICVRTFSLFTIHRRGGLGMQETEEYVNERLDHLGIVAGVCQEIGLAGWLDAQAPERRQQVSVGTATVAMVLNGLGFSHRQLYLVPQFFAHKPVEHLAGAGVSGELVHNYCFRRTLDLVYEHDLTQLLS